MRRAAGLLSALLIDATIAIKQRQTDSCTTTGSDVDVINAFVEGYNAQDVQMVLPSLSPNFTRYSSTTSEPMKLDRWTEMWTSFVTAFPDEWWQITKLESCAPGEVTIDVIERGTFVNDWVLFDGTVIEPTGWDYEGDSTIDFFLDEEHMITSYEQSTGIAFLEVGLGPSDIVAIVENGY